MHLTKTIALALICLSLSCSGTNSSSGADQSNPGNGQNNTKRDNEVKRIAKEIENKATTLIEYLGEDGKCDRSRYTDESSPCFLEEIAFEGAEPKESSLGQRILILDWRMTYIGTTIFKSRVLASYQFQPSTNLLQLFPYDFVEGKDKFKATRFHLDIHSDLIGASEYKIPSKSFRRLWDTYNWKVIDRFENYFSINASFFDAPSFGYLNLAFLYDHLPEAQFVLVNDEALDRYHVQPDIFCDIKNTPKDYLQDLFSRKTEQVRSVAREHKINFIVIARNADFSEMKSHFEEICLEPLDNETEGAIENLYHLVNKYRDSMTTLSGVTVFHAAPKIFENTEHPLCQNVNNRIVTGTTTRNRIFTSIPALGSSDLKKYTEPLEGNRCIDSFAHIARPSSRKDLVSQSASFSTLEFNDQEDNMLTYLSRSRLSPSVVLAYSINKMKTDGIEQNQIKEVLKRQPVISPVQHSLTPMCKSDSSYCDYFYKYF